MQKSEQGFVLIGAVWLLLLCASLVAILLLRSRATAAAVSQEAITLQRDLDLDAARETVAADLLINGPRSKWWRLPARGTIAVGSQSIEIVITSELGRLDLNDADLAIIQNALRGLGFLSSDRERFAAALLARRRKGRITSSADADELIGQLARSNVDGICLSDFFTIEGGLAQPDSARVSALLARALGEMDSSNADPIRSGETLRIEAATPHGASLLSVQRIGIFGSFPIAVSQRTISASCRR